MTEGSREDGMRPILATDRQVAAEKAVLRLLSDHEVVEALAKQRERLAECAIAQTPAGRARLGHAIDTWAGGLALRWLSGDPEDPAILLTTDNTPRAWLGHEMPATGAAGDNPDHIYRNTFIEGARRYEVVGRLDPVFPPSQFGIEAMRGLPGKVVVSAAASGTAVRNQIGVLTNREIETDAEGHFRVTLGPEDAAGPNHLKTTDEPISLVIRDVLSDWRQVPTIVTLRQLDRPHGARMTYDAFKARVLDDLPEYLDFWTRFPLAWMGGVEPNGFRAPVPREGGWGYQAGIRYRLGQDEMLVVTMRRGESDYLGIQICDPWFLASDARSHVTSLNTTQSQQNPDGSYTYVVATKDPGVANWLDTDGLDEGMGVLRWQGVAPGADIKSCLVEVRKIDRATLDRDYSALPRLGPEQRAEQRQRHATDYRRRFEFIA